MSTLGNYQQHKTKQKVQQNYKLNQIKLISWNNKGSSIQLANNVHRKGYRLVLFDWHNWGTKRNDCSKERFWIKTLHKTNIPLHIKHFAGMKRTENDGMINKWNELNCLQ